MPLGTEGDCKYADGIFCIRISNELSPQSQIDVLTHEFSHVLSWDEEKEHGTMWGKKYAEVYNLYARWVEGRDG